MVVSRRVRKRSTSSSLLLPTYVALLAPLQLALQCTHSSKNPLFELQVQRRSSRWSFSRPFEDFEALHKRLTLALQHGHFCSAGCPWLFSFLTSEFPKKHLFQWNSSPKTVEVRRQKLLQLLTSTLEFLLDRKSHSCSVVTTDVAKQLVEFLYEENAIAQCILESYSESETNNSSRRRGLVCSEEEVTTDGTCTEVAALTLCGVCNNPLACTVEREKSTVSPVSSGSRRRSSVYATALQCGHQFHDECIVPVLNETLRCPTCHHLEIQ